MDLTVYRDLANVKQVKVIINDIIQRLNDIESGAHIVKKAYEDELGNNFVSTYALIDEAGNNLSFTMDPQTYILTLTLYNKKGEVLSTQSVDLPSEDLKEELEAEIAARIAKDAEHDQAIAERITKDAEQDQAIAACVTKDAEQDQAIAERVAKDEEQDQALIDRVVVVWEEL